MGGKTKRGLEKDTSKVSPPSKMAKNKETFETEVIAKLDAIGSRFSSFEARFDKLEAEVAKVTQAIKDIEAAREEFKEEVNAMKVVNESYQRMEIEAKKRSVLVRGLKFMTTKQYETLQETKAALATLFEKLEMQPVLVDYQRLGGLRAGEDGSKISIRIQFADVDQRLDLFDRLKDMGRELSYVSILTDYPHFQLTQFKELSNAGYNIRKESPGTKTRIIPKGLGLALQRRANPEDRWMAVSV